MKVPLVDLKRQFASIERDVRAQVDEVFASQRFILGPKVKELEARLARYVGVEAAVGVSSGTDALLISLMALDAGPGTAVVTTPFTFFATAGVVSRLGARPVFVDIDPVSFNLSPAGLAGFFENETDGAPSGPRLKSTGEEVVAILPVHIFGQVADMEPIVDMAARYRVAVVEDAAQAIGADFKGRPAGSIGRAGCFSFFPTKNLGAAGDAGFVSSDAALGEKITRLRVHGGFPKYYHQIIGGNFRLDELQAAVLLAKLPLLEAWTEKRRANALAYNGLLESSGPVREGLVSLPEVTAEGKRPHVFNQYVIRARDRDSLKAHLAQRGVGTEIYYPVPLHLQECFAPLGYKPGSMPESERAAGEVLALPVFPELEPEEIEYVAGCILEFYG